MARDRGESDQVGDCRMKRSYGCSHQEVQKAGVRIVRNATTAQRKLRKNGCDDRIEKPLLRQRPTHTAKEPSARITLWHGRQSQIVHAVA